MITHMSMSMPSANAGMIYRVGIAARLSTTTSTRAVMAAIISGNAAPFNTIDAIVSGKNTAVVISRLIPVHAMWCCASWLADHLKNVLINEWVFTGSLYAIEVLSLEIIYLIVLFFRTQR